MKHLMFIFCLVFVCLTCGVTGAQKTAQLSNLNEFKSIEKAMFVADKEEQSSSDPVNSNQLCPEAQYLWSLQKSLSKVPVRNRADLLIKLNRKTHWGSYQRYISSYVCAWYHVNYTRSRNYLFHAAFWVSSQIGPYNSHPFSFDDVCVDQLYALYERNHDFKVLHDLITTQSGAHTGEMIVCFTEEAITKHPRGILHVANISAKGHNFVSRILNLSPDDDNHPLFILGGTEKSIKTFRTYTTRVANDPKDPLCAQARSLLKKKRSK